MDLLVIIGMVLVVTGAIIGASYVFAITAEREPDLELDPEMHTGKPTRRPTTSVR